MEKYSRIGGCVAISIRERQRLPRKYLEHAAVRVYLSAKQYQSHCEVLGFEPYSAQEMVEFQNAVNELEKQYGDSFVKGDYGWPLLL